ncbi:hypothetical protein V6N13_011911 [Hibiscus sabdariffa]
MVGKSKTESRTRAHQGQGRMRNFKTTPPGYDLTICLRASQDRIHKLFRPQVRSGQGFLFLNGNKMFDPLSSLAFECSPNMIVLPSDLI